MAPLQNDTNSGGTLGRAVVVAFAASVAVWITWFVTHLPWLGMAEQTSLPILLVVWLAAAACAAARSGAKNAITVGLLGGIGCALVGLLILGSKLVPAAAADGTTPGGLPSIALIVPGFLLLGAAIGAAAGALSRMLPQRDAAASRPLAQMSVVVAVGITPLLVVGGLVTSTNSGMAVPDWPNTFGSNMFLYPLGPRSSPGLFLEHSHRLFGTLVGLLSLVLAIWTSVSEQRRWVKVLAWTVFALVCAQGILGGIRVRLGDADAGLDKPIWAMLHGVLAQLVFGTAVGLAAALSPLFTSAIRLPKDPAIRRFKLFATGLTHSLILQLIFGAMYRHMRSSHALWTHAAFSLVIMIMAIVAGFVAIRLARPADGEESPAGAAAGVPALSCTLRRIGIGLVVVVGLQFALGWSAFFVGGAERTAANPTEAIIRTAHQANGAVLIAFAALAFVWSRWAMRRSAEPSDSPRPTAA